MLSVCILSHLRWQCRSQWPRDLRRRSASARLLRLWVRIPPRTWMSVCCECCVLSGRGLCVGLITRPEESYRLWCVVMCDLETSWMRRSWPTGVCCAQINNKRWQHGWQNYVAVYCVQQINLNILGCVCWYYCCIVENSTSNGPRRPWGGVEVQLYFFFNLDTSGWMFNATPRPLYPRERPDTHCIVGWVGPRTGLDGCGESRPQRDSIPGPVNP